MICVILWGVAVIMAAHRGQFGDVTLGPTRGGPAIIDIIKPHGAKNQNHSPSQFFSDFYCQPGMLQLVFIVHEIYGN